MMFYLVPALYPLARLPNPYRKWVSYNPMTGILEMNRAVWFPSYWTGWQPVYFSVIGAVVILVRRLLGVQPGRGGRPQGAVRR